MVLESNNHSVFKLHYHLIMVIKYRREVIDGLISARLKKIFEYIAPKYNIRVEEWNHDKDHIHVLFTAQPNSELSKFINAYKSASSRLIKKGIPVHQKVSLGGNVLVKVVLPVDDRRRNCRHHQTIYPVSGAET